MAFEGAIFDFDGVIIDSASLHYQAWEKLFISDYNLPFNQTIYTEKVTGRRSADVIPQLLPHLATEETRTALQLKQQYYHNLIEEESAIVFDSTVNLIRELLRLNSMPLKTKDYLENLKRLLSQFLGRKKYLSLYKLKRLLPLQKILIQLSEALGRDWLLCF